MAVKAIATEKFAIPSETKKVKKNYLLTWTSAQS